MQVMKGSITTLASEGRCTLQVPDCYITLPDDPEPLDLDLEDCPDDWFVVLKDGRVPAVGKENGFLFLTRKGYEANKAALKAAFGTARKRGTTWSDFEKKAEEHFAEVEKATEKKLNDLKKKVAELEAAQALLAGQKGGTP